MRRSGAWISLLLATLLTAAPAGGQAILIDKDAAGTPEARRGFLVPYAFHSDVLDLAFGFAAGGRGLLQEQTGAVLNLVAGTNGSVVGYFFVEGIELPWSNRLFLSPRIMGGDYGEIDSFQNGNPEFPDERAGSNDSSEDNFIRSEGTDQWYRLLARYVLPIGHGRDQPVPTYVLDRGILESGASGGESWNPLRSGRTAIEIEPFWRKQDFDADLGRDELETGGLRLRLRRENVDFLPNPSEGSVQRLTVSRDWGVQDDDSSYTVVEVELAKFFSLGESEHFRQRVLALDLWTADTPTWDVVQVDDRDVIQHRPPPYFGATLGGINRLRGYPSARFNDKAAIYYAAELRLIPRWNPLGQIDWLNRLVRVDWIQLVGFAEAGRVAEHWNLSDLHTDMKWSAGLGLRAFVNGLVVRADVGFSQEGGEVQMMVSHPFPEL
jgi:hypothetical protein